MSFSAGDAYSIQIYFHVKFINNLDFTRVGDFHRQGISGRSYSQLCFALNNKAYGSVRLACKVKIDET